MMATATPAPAPPPVVHKMPPRPELDPLIRGETFQGHWEQLRDIATTETVPSGDDMVAVLNLLDQMISLLQLELQAEEKMAALVAQEQGDDGQIESGLDLDRDPLDSMREPVLPCLDLLLSDNILSHVLATSRMPIEDRHADKLRTQQLWLYGTLLGSRQAKTLLSHQPFLRPMLELLNHFSTSCNNNEDLAKTNGGGKYDTSSDSSDMELYLMLLLNELCGILAEDLDLLDLFCQASQDRFRQVFSLLVKHLHKEGAVGQTARDALLHCMALSAKNEEVGAFIGKNSDFCPVLAMSLCGLYSALPRRLPACMISDQSWHRLSSQDLESMHEVTAFLSSLGFCDAVVQVAHPSVKENLLGLVFIGFLVPVMGPALMQNSEDELICTTAYLTLFLERVTETALLATFLKFMFVDSQDGRTVADALTFRLSTQTKLCQVTLSLFDLVVGLNCEDVMFWLVFRHLIPLRHLLPSRRDSIREPDLHGRAAQKFLSMFPICTQEAAATYQAFLAKGGASMPHSGSVSFSQIFSSLSINSSERKLSASASDDGEDHGEHYYLYLKDARRIVRACSEACLNWQYEYDGLNPPPNALDHQDDDEGDQQQACDNEAAATETAASSGYTSLVQQQQSAPPNAALVADDSLLTSEEDREFWNLMRDPAVPEARLNRVIRKMQAADAISNNSSLASSSEWSSPRDALVGINRLHLQGRRSGQFIGNQQEDIDLSITSLGSFLDLLLEKVELMPSNTLTTNLLTTSIISRLCAHPHPILRSALSLPEGDSALQPSVRGLHKALSSLRQRLDNVMPTMDGADAAIITARRFLHDRVVAASEKKEPKSMQKRTEAAVAQVANTISHIGQEASKHKSSLTAAFSSMFKRRSSSTATSSSVYSSPHTSAPPSLQTPVAAEADNSNHNDLSNGHNHHHLGDEVKRYALAAVLMDEWLLELSAIAQEQSVLQNKKAYEVGMGIDKSTS